MKMLCYGTLTENPEIQKKFLMWLLKKDLVLRVTKDLERSGNFTEQYNNTSLICNWWL